MGDGGRGDEQIVGANDLSSLGELCPQTRVNTRGDEVEGDDGHMRQEDFDEALTPQSSLRCLGAMNANEQFGGGDAGQRNGFVGNEYGQILERAPRSLHLNEDAGVY